MKRPLITAHTGCMNTPPNSIESILEGIKAGADIIEVDVRATKDGVAVLLHDEKIVTPKGVRRVGDLSFKELHDLDRSSRIFRLEEALSIVKEHHRIINLDVKEDSAIDPMIETIEKHKMRDYVIISGCERERANYLKNHYRLYQVLLNVGISLYETYKEDYESFIRKTCWEAIEASCCGININYQFCDESLVSYATIRCIPVWVWTIDEPDVMKKFLDMGVYSITTNEVKILVELGNQAK
ncbi:glycerophosphodiester phosphodiesterase family protein [Geobacillus sp. 47C-IIb]|uniref:glycerophosphodiester phosphodiesterase n=2 Tax=Geobacillus TaxID=129337 RepID=UPI001680B2F2|nr:glycerophosphodiester phosphodiesterase family protein [Geobacillus sp. 47C-IIb]QNU31519.1 hypothetical protein IC804_01475 [Geobacillus sp. 47C-IIb]